MTPRAVLVSARELISEQEHWTTGYYSRTKENTNCDPEDRLAVKWCLAGAVKKARGPREAGYDEVIYTAYRLIDAALSSLEFNGQTWTHIGVFNDSHTHEQVLQVLDKAIEIADS